MSSSSWTPIGPDSNLSRRKKELKGQLKKTAKNIMPTGTFLFITHYILKFGPGSLKKFNFIERSQKWLFLLSGTGGLSTLVLLFCNFGTKCLWQKF